MTSTLEILRARRAELQAIGKKYGVYNIRVFGSVLRGEDSENSDIDLLVDMEEGRSLIDFIAFKQDAEAMLGREVDILSAKALHPLLKPYIVEDAERL